MGKEVGGFLAKKFCQLGESILGPSQETMAATEQQLLNLVRSDVEKAGVQPGGAHRIIVQREIPLLDKIIADTINILVSSEGSELKVGPIERVEINDRVHSYAPLGSLNGRARLAVINKKIKELTEHQS